MASRCTADLDERTHPCLQVTKYHESALIEAQILQDVNVRERNSRRGSADSSLCVEMFNQLEHQVQENGPTFTPVRWCRVVLCVCVCVCVLDSPRLRCGSCSMDGGYVWPDGSLGVEC